MAGFSLAQEAASPAGAAPATQAANRAAIDDVFLAYVNAYAHKSIDELVAIWPDLPNQKKDYKKIKSQLQDARISGEKVTMHSLETNVTNDDAVVKCERTEEYVKTETEAEAIGDATMASPAQRQPPVQVTTKKQKKTTDTVWVKLHKNGNAWKIVSISDKP